MSKHRTDKKPGKNISQAQNRPGMDKDLQRKAGAKGTPAHLGKDMDNDQIGNADTLNKGYQASGRFQNDVDDDEFGNRAQNQNYDRAVQGSSSRNVQNDDTRGRMAGSKDWAEDKSGKQMNADKQTPANRNFNASSKDATDKDKEKDQRRAAGKGDSSSSKR